MNTKNEEIEKNMQSMEKVVPEDPTEGIFDANIEGDKGAPDIEIPEFRVKSTYLKSSGSLHIQLGHPNPSEIHELMEEELGTPFVQTGSDRVLRLYGVAFNIPTAHGSIDMHEMQELGYRLNEQEQIISFASNTPDYVSMKFIGVVDGRDNRQEDVKMLQFEIGDGEKLFVAFSHLDAVVKHQNENYPTIRQEWFLAWLVSNFFPSNDQEEGDTDE